MQTVMHVVVYVGATVAALYFALTLAILVAAFGVMFKRRGRGTQAAALSAAAKAFGATVGRLTVPGVVTNTVGFEHAVGSHKLYVFGFHRGRDHFVEMLLAAPAKRGYVMLKRRGPRWLAAIGNVIGFGSGLDYGEEFERTVSIESEEDDAAKRAVLDSPEIRRGIMLALESFSTVCVSPRGASVGNDMVDAARIPFAAIADALRAICEMPAPVGEVVGKPPRARAESYAYLATPFVGCIFLLVTYAALGRRWPIGAEGWKQGFGIAICAWLIMMLGVHAHIRRTTRSFGFFIFAVWTTALGVPLCIASLLWTANAALDRSPLQHVRATVVGKVHSDSLRSGPRWMLRLRPDGPDETWSEYVSHKRYDSVQPGDIEFADVHHGLFGWPWGDWKRRE